MGTRNDSNIKANFPSQTVSDAEKLSEDYGIEIGKAIEREWFDVGTGFNKFHTNESCFH